MVKKLSLQEFQSVLEQQRSDHDRLIYIQAEKSWTKPRGQDSMIAQTPIS